ncbi:MAG: SGNH/GDSL hydrolase family protein, partial [Planctomycetota bacterium]
RDPVLNHVLIGTALAVLVVATVRAAGGERVLLATDFESDPREAGWTLGGYPHQEPKGSWTDKTSVSGRRALRSDEGWWSSPRLEVEPLAWYRVTFAATVEGKGYWWVKFFDADGEGLDSDHYSSVYPSDEWQSHDFCFRARHNAAWAELRFQAVAAPLFIDDPRVETISREEVARWADRKYLELPPARLDAVPRAGTLLARTMARLRDGKTLRVVMLGDSIVNDIGNSPWDVLVERAWPGGRIELILSVRGGTGCQWYKQDNRVQPYVLDHRPDLLVIGGISNGHDPESIRAVIRQVRAKQDPDILVLSGALSTWDDFQRHIARWPEDKQQEAMRRARAYRPGLERMTAEEEAAYFDLRAHWDAYVERIRKHPEWLRRDRPHANCRGRMVLARLLAAWFAPPKAVSR